jgi:hypothetical protein
MTCVIILGRFCFDLTDYNKRFEKREVKRGTQKHAYFQMPKVLNSVFFTSEVQIRLARLRKKITDFCLT